MSDDRSQETEDKRPSVFRSLLSVFCIIILAFTAYSNTFHSEFQFDDKDFIVNNPAIRDITDTGAIWRSKGLPQRFIPFLTFALNYHFHKLDVFGYHLVNIVIHIVNALLVMWLAQLIMVTDTFFRHEKRERKVSVTIFAALIFLLHPVQTETVTYITQRFASLTAMFYLASFCFYVSARAIPRAPIIKFTLSAVCAILAMLSKQIAFTLPVMIIIYEIYFHDRHSAPRRDALRSAPAIAGAVIVFLFILFIPFSYKFNAAGILGREFISRSHEGDYLYWLPYALTQFKVICKYIQLVLVPLGQNFDYDFPAVYSLMEPQALACFAIVCALLYVTIRLYNTHRLASFCLAWFFVALSVESSIIVLPHVIFEHRLYLPMAGVAILVSILASDTKKVTDTFLGHFSWKKVSVTFLIVIYGVLTYQRNQVWHNGITLWTDVIKKSPHKSRPYHNRGFHYLEKKKYTKALNDFNRAIELQPRYLQAYNNRATAFRSLGKPLEALKDYSAAIELRSDNAAAYHNRGQLLFEMGYTQEALADYARALAVNPQYFLAHYNRGRLYAQIKSYPQALADFERTIELYPDFAYTYGERGRVYLLLERNKEALADFSRCLDERRGGALPNLNCLNNRAIIYSRLRDFPRAIADMNQLIRLDPQNGAAFFNRSLIYLAKENFLQALDDALEAEQRGFPVDKTYLERLKNLAQEAPAP